MTTKTEDFNQENDNDKPNIGEIITNTNGDILKITKISHMTVDELMEITEKEGPLENDPNIFYKLHTTKPNIIWIANVEKQD